MILSYRAISATINYNKIYEKLLLTIIEDQVIKNRITNPYQYGLVPGNCTEFQLIVLVDYITSSFNRKDCEFVNLVFFDYKDAFNKVDHQLILKHLDSIGIRGATLQLFQDYFSNRE